MFRPQHSQTLPAILIVVAFAAATPATAADVTVTLDAGDPEVREAKQVEGP